MTKIHTLGTNLKRITDSSQYKPIKQQEQHNTQQDKPVNNNI